MRQPRHLLSSHSLFTVDAVALPFEDAKSEFLGLSHIPCTATPYKSDSLGCLVILCLRIASLGVFLLLEKWWYSLHFRLRYRLYRWPDPHQMPNDGKVASPDLVVVRTSNGAEYTGRVYQVALAQDTANVLFAAATQRKGCYTTISSVVPMTTEGNDAAKEAFSCASCENTDNFGEQRNPWEKNPATSERHQYHHESHFPKEASYAESGGASARGTSLTQPLLDPVPRVLLTIVEVECVRFFLHCSGNHPWCLRPLRSSDFLLQQGSLGQGVPPAALRERRALFLEFLEDKVRRRNWIWHLVDALTHPWFGFQASCVALWWWDQYYVYALAVVALAALETAAEVRSTLATENNILALDSTKRECDKSIITVVRPGTGLSAYDPRCHCLRTRQQIRVRDLVPGDVICIRAEMRLPCDVALLYGSAVVDEAALTGANAPALRVAVPSSMLEASDRDVGSGDLCCGCCCSFVSPLFRTDPHGQAQTLLNMSSTSAGIPNASVPTTAVSLQRQRTSATSFTVENFSADHGTFSEASQGLHQHRLYAGTTVISLGQEQLATVGGGLALRDHAAASNGELPAVVLSVGLQTRQGRLIRSLWCSQTDSRFETEVLQFLVWMFLATLVGVATSVAAAWKYRFSIRDATIRSLDLFTDSIPPALPSVLSVGVGGAVYRLKKRHDISCVDLSRVTRAASVRMVLFSKTGTLTEPELEFGGALMIENFKFSETAELVCRGRKSLVEGPQRGAEPAQPVQLSPTCLPSAVPALTVRPSFGPRRFHVTTTASPEFVQALATCHAVSVVSGELQGDVMDVEMMKLVRWNIHDVETECHLTAQVALGRLTTTGEPCAAAADETYKGLSLDFLKAKRAALQTILSLYGVAPGTNSAWPVIVKPPGVTLSVTQLLRSGYHLPELLHVLRCVRNKKPLESEREMALSRLLNQSGFSELGIIRRFPFTPTHRRISVICRDPLTQQTYLFAKGSPENIGALCTASSLPRDYDHRIAIIAKKGARVVCVAARRLGRLSGRVVERLSRREAERKLQFLGCVIFANRLKPDSKKCIANLLEADCRVILATGDSPLATLAIAKECGLLKGKEIILGDVDYFANEEGRPGVMYPELVWTKLEQPPAVKGARSNNTPYNALLSSSSEDGRIRCSSQTESCMLSSLTDQTTLSLRLLEAHSRKTTTRNLQDFLRGKHPRNFEFLLSGRAFRRLQHLHETLMLDWFHSPARRLDSMVGVFSLIPESPSTATGTVVSPSAVSPSIVPRRVTADCAVGAYGSVSNQCWGLVKSKRSQPPCLMKFHLLQGGTFPGDGNAEAGTVLNESPFRCTVAEAALTRLTARHYVPPVSTLHSNLHIPLLAATPVYATLDKAGLSPGSSSPDAMNSVVVDMSPGSSATPHDFSSPAASLSQQVLVSLIYSEKIPAGSQPQQSQSFLPTTVCHSSLSFLNPSSHGVPSEWPPLRLPSTSFASGRSHDDGLQRLPRQNGFYSWRAACAFMLGGGKPSQRRVSSSSLLLSSAAARIDQPLLVRQGRYDHAPLDPREDGRYERNSLGSSDDSSSIINSNRLFSSSPPTGRRLLEVLFDEESSVADTARLYTSAPPSPIRSLYGDDSSVRDSTGSATGRRSSGQRQAAATILFTAPAVNSARSRPSHIGNTASLGLDQFTKSTHFTSQSASPQHPRTAVENDSSSKNVAAAGNNFDQHSLEQLRQQPPDSTTAAVDQRRFTLVRLSLFEYLLRATSIFARMSPEDKTSLTAFLRDLEGNSRGTLAGCGDGPNDMQLLWASDVGIGVGCKPVNTMLAPFCTTRRSVASCESVLTEGRAALARALSVFEFIMLSCAAQFFTVCLLYAYGINYSNWQYFFVDFFLVLPLSLALIHLPAAGEALNGPPPDNTLLNGPVQTAFLVQSVLTATCAAVALILVRYIPGWTPVFVTAAAGDGDGPEFASYENSITFLFTNAAYLVSALVCLEEASPWLESAWQSRTFCLVWGVLATFSLSLIVAPRPGVVPPPSAANPAPDPFVLPPGTRVFPNALFATVDEWLCLLLMPISGRLATLCLVAVYASVSIALSRERKKQHRATAARSKGLRAAAAAEPYYTARGAEGAKYDVQYAL